LAAQLPKRDAEFFKLILPSGGIQRQELIVPEIFFGCGIFLTGEQQSSLSASRASA